MCLLMCLSDSMNSVYYCICLHCRQGPLVPHGDVKLWSNNNKIMDSADIINYYRNFVKEPQRCQSTHKRRPSFLEQGTHMHLLMISMLISVTPDTFAYRDITCMS